jgi:hypothetical protein
MWGKSRKEVSMNNTNNYVIEFAAFTLAKGVDESTLLNASDALQVEFLEQQKGFLKRDLAKMADGKWADILYWDSQESADQAIQAAPHHPAALKYFQLMANIGQNNPTAAMMFLSVVKSYS